VLFVCGFRIFPCDTGGHIRTGGIAAALARMGHEVSIYSLAGRNADYGARSLFGPSFRIDRIEPNLSEETNLGLGFGAMQSLMRRLGYPRYWQNRLLRRGMVPPRLKRALRWADVIVSDMPWCPPVPGPWSAKPWFMLSHNLEYRLLEQGPPPHRRFAEWMRREESAAPRLFRDIFACTEEDRDFFRAHDTGGRLQLPIIRCGVDPAAYEVPAGTRERIRAELGIGGDDLLLVFAGSGFAPNVEALERLREFSRSEAEFLARERIHLMILGSLCPAAFREGALFATGRVAEVAPYFAAADAGINAVTRGSGANIKLFEYLAARLPVISTPFGVRGTPLEPDVDFLEYEPHNLRDVIERFKRSRTRAQWQEYTRAVWARHRREFDIQELVRDTVAALPEFTASLRPAPATRRA
jgi:glycosyltransferase involved in cell wall biosynthesis